MIFLKVMNKKEKTMKNLPIGIQTFAKIRDKKEHYIF